MIDMNALDNDPWKTIPVQKDDLRKLASALQYMEHELRILVKTCNHMHATLSIIAEQQVEPRAARMARRALEDQP